MAVTRSGGKRRKTSGNKYCFNENDFISRLPDGMLLSILDKLPVRDYLIASAVAQRWERLWKSVSTVDVDDRMEKDGGKNAKKFLTSFIKNNQSDKLKQFFSVPKLPSFCLSSLKSLRLDRSQLPDNGVEIITANCPLLDVLVLCNCNKDTNLKINVATHFILAILIVNDKDRLALGQSPETSISAPKVKYLGIWGNTHMRKYSLDNVHNVFEAKLDFLETKRVPYVRDFVPQIRMNIVKILEKLVRVKRLHLCTRCILATIAMRERDLRFNLTRLELDTHLRRKDLIGISLQFRACSQLKELVVNIRLPPVLVHQTD